MDRIWCFNLLRVSSDHRLFLYCDGKGFWQLHHFKSALQDLDNKEMQFLYINGVVVPVYLYGHGPYGEKKIHQLKT